MKRVRLFLRGYNYMEERKERWRRKDGSLRDLVGQIVSIAVPVHSLTGNGQETAHCLDGVAVHIQIHFFQTALEVALQLLNSSSYIRGGSRRFLLTPSQ